MNLRLTPRALADAKRMKTWWQRHRPKAPDLFEQELTAALERIASAPNLGSIYEGGGGNAEVRRLLMPKTRNHVYYAVEANAVVVLTVWGAPKRGPKL
jgi:plasmid stabilization system protein ParE